MGKAITVGGMTALLALGVAMGACEVETEIADGRGAGGGAGTAGTAGGGNGTAGSGNGGATGDDAGAPGTGGASAGANARGGGGGNGGSVAGGSGGASGQPGGSAGEAGANCPDDGALTIEAYCENGDCPDSPREAFERGQVGACVDSGEVRTGCDRIDVRYEFGLSSHRYVFDAQSGALVYTSYIDDVVGPCGRSAHSAGTLPPVCEDFESSCAVCDPGFGADPLVCRFDCNCDELEPSADPCAGETCECYCSRLASTGTNGAGGAPGAGGQAGGSADAAGEAGR